MTSIRCAICSEPLPRELAAGPTHRATCPDRRKEAPASAHPAGASLRGPGRESTAAGTGVPPTPVSPAATDPQAPT